MEDYMTLSEIAQTLGVSEQRSRQRLKEAGINPLGKIGCLLRWPPNSVEILNGIPPKRQGRPQLICVGELMCQCYVPAFNHGRWVRWEEIQAAVMAKAQFLGLQPKGTRLFPVFGKKIELPAYSVIDTEILRDAMSYTRHIADTNAMQLVQDEADIDAFLARQAAKED